jgi:hypothetical protein
MAFCWIIGSAVLTLGCVSQQIYDNARQEAQEHAGELAQVKGDIQSLEQQRDATHAANQRGEKTLSNLKSEIRQLQVSLDQIQKTNQAKLAALRLNIAALRARHQAMVKEISDTKRYERRLQAITAQQMEEMAHLPAGPEPHVAMMESIPQKPPMVAVVTPEVPEADHSTTMTPLNLSPSQATDTSTAGLTAPVAAPPQTAASVAPSPAAPSSIPAKAVQAAPMTAPAPNHSTPSAPQEDSWFSGLTGWLASLFGWIWI